MSNFHDTFETRTRSFIIAFSICMTVPLSDKIVLVTLLHSLSYINISVTVINSNMCIKRWIKKYNRHSRGGSRAAVTSKMEHFARTFYADFP